MRAFARLLPWIVLGFAAAPLAAQSPSPTPKDWQQWQPQTDRSDARLEARVGRRFEELELIRAIGAARTPALVVHDRADREVDFSNAEALARAWPGSRLHATSGLGHRRILRDPAVLADVATFVVGRLPRCSCGRLATGSGHGPPRCLGCALADDLWARERRRGRRVHAPPSGALRTGS